jgi:hypothetical protein
VNSIPTGIDDLLAVACTTATSCEAVGDTFDNKALQYEAILLQGPGIGTPTWTEETVPAGAQSLGGISCSSAASCIAVGQDSNGDGLVISGPGAGDIPTWTREPVPAEVKLLDSVSCTSPATCTAVGSSTSGDGVILAGPGSGPTPAWRSEQVPTGVTEVDGVSCSGPAGCIAVGSTASSGLDYSVEGATALYGPVTGSPVWTEEPVGTSLEDLFGVSCTNGGSCFALGVTPSDVLILSGSSNPPVSTPSVGSVTPSSGPDAGGTAVTISGSGFTGATGVYFGPWPAASFSVVTDTTITAVTPSGVLGEVDVKVESSGAISFPDPCTDEFEGSMAPQSPAPDGLVPIAPSRVIDTRLQDQSTYQENPVHTIRACSELDFSTAPLGATAVALNVTVVDAAEAGSLTVWPAGQARPAAPNLEFGPGSIVADLVAIPLGLDGTVAIFNDSPGTADVVADMEGYFYDASYGGGYTPLRPARLCDTRSLDEVGYTTPCTGKAPQSGQSLEVNVAGMGGVPATGATEVMLDVVATEATGSGFLTVYPSNDVQPGTSDLNYTAGQVVSNHVLVPVGPDGGVLVASSAGDPQIVVDVDGYYSDSAPGVFHPLPPMSIASGRIPPSATLALKIAGSGGVPATGATAVALQVTASGNQASFLTAHPGDGTLPLASDLDWAGGESVTGLLAVGVPVTGTGSGSVDLYNYAGDANVEVTVVGWYG